MFCIDATRSSKCSEVKKKKMAASLQRILRRLVPGVRRDRGGSSEVRTETVRQGSELKCIS